MKRFSFFLAVFSIGLLLFLLITGQFGSMFSGKSTSVTEPGGSDEAETPLVVEPEKNLVTHHVHDYDKGRVRMTVSGEIEGENQLSVLGGGIGDPRTLVNAKVEIPIYPDDLDLPAEDVFEFRAERVVYEPGESESGDHVRLEGKIHGEGRESGYPRFDTRDVSVALIADGAAQMKGSEAVQLEYPAITLRGQKGLVAEIAGADGLTNITLHPPLLAALTSEAGGSILGFSEGTLPPSEGEQGSKTRIDLFSQGSMHIDPENSRAVIEGPVYVYQVPADTSLNPPRLEDLPDHHFQCERMILELDGRSRAITRLVAERVDEPVRVFLADQYRIEGDKLVWSLGQQEAHLSDHVRIFGDIGEVIAGGAKIRPEEGVCRLIDGVTATIRGDALPSSGEANSGGAASSGRDGDDEWDERLAGEWILEADHAELHYTHGGRRSGGKGDALRFFRALAAPGERVTIREDREEGAVLLGGEMTYDPNLGAIRILPGDAPDAERPDFREGLNRVRSGQIDLSLTSPRLEFSRDVDATLFELPIGPEGEWPRWLAPREGGEEMQTNLTASRLRLSSTADHDLRRLEAWGEEGNPLLLTHRAEKTLQFTAQAVDWDGPGETIRAFGNGMQRMVLEDRADISAREIRFSLANWIARGDGEVHAIAMRPPPKNGEGPAPPPLTLDGPHVAVTLRPPSVDEAAAGDENGVATPASTANARPVIGQEEPRTGEVIAARAWSDTPGSVVVDEGTLRLIGDEWDWDAIRGEIRLHGRGRQRVIYSGVDGENELSATSLVYRSSDKRLVLEGETRGQILQGAVVDPADTEDRRLPWTVRAGSLVAHFRTVGSEERLELDRIVAGDKVSLSQPESEIELHGDTAEWDAVTERLRIYSPNGQGVQTLYRGNERRSELIAREILVVRPNTLAPGRLDRIEVLFIDVLQATVHLSDQAPSDPENPDEFTLSAENLIVGFSGMRDVEEGPGGIGMPISEARAWGNVDFKGGAYKILCHRTMFRRAARTLYFEGQGRQKVQIIAKGETSIPARNKMSIEWKPPQGYIFRSVPSGQNWSQSQIEQTLKLFGREDRAKEK